MDRLLPLACRKVLSMKEARDAALAVMHKAEARRELQNKPTVKDLIQFVDENFEQAKIPVEHFFSEGFYWREIVMPAGMVGAGHKHKHRHLNFALSGRAIVTCDGHSQVIEAPFIFWSEPGAQKAFQVFEEMRWLTRHDNPDELRDILEIEKMIFELPQENLKSGLTVDEHRMNKKPLCLDSSRLRS